MSDKANLTPEERIAQLEREVADRRETNTRLNRRCQAQESYVMRREMRRVWRHVGDLYYGVVIGRRDAIRAAVLREREACAVVVEELDWASREHAAAAIRGRE